MNDVKLVFTLGAALFLSACSTTAIDQPENKAHTETLIQATQSWDGGDFVYPEGDAQLTIVRITIPKGVSLPMHCHPVPLGGVLTAGILEVKKQDGQIFLLNEDEALIEVSNQWHYGRAIEDVEIIVVYAGANEVPVTVFKDGDPGFEEACH